MTFKAPVAAQKPKDLTYHNDKLTDNYFWLREKENPEVISYLNSENDYSAKILQRTEGLSETIYREFLSRIKQTDSSAPFRDGEFYYYRRTIEGKEYSVLCRKRGINGAEEILIDENKMAEGQKYFSLGAWDVSSDGKLIAYAVDLTGFREYNLYVMDISSRRIVSSKIGKVNSFTWANDNRTLFYVREDNAKRPFKVFSREYDADTEKALYEEKDELFRLYVSKSLDNKYVFTTSSSSTTTEYRYLELDKSGAELRIILPRSNDHEYHVEHRDGLFYIQTNRQAPEFRIVTTPVNDPSEKNWKEVVPAQGEDKVESYLVLKNHLVYVLKRQGLNEMHVVDLLTNQTHKLPTKESVYNISFGPNRVFDTDVLRYSYSSYVTPPSDFDYNLNGKSTSLIKQLEVPNYSPEKYDSQRVFITVRDGEKVPVSIIYKKDTLNKKPAPLFLYGYGSYGHPMTVSFSSPRISFLDRGFVFAIAHIRGGGDLGEKWHKAGKLKKKMNTFYDFIDVADYLVKEGWTTHQKLVMEGGSAGGLLMGAVINLRPDLAKAAHIAVPFVDVVNTMMDATLPLTVQEYLEWGNPNNKDEYEYIKQYCPYTNLKKTKYPHILVTTSLNDSQVMYWEPAKYVAKMRTLKEDQNELVFKINMDAGHGGASGRYSYLKEKAEQWAYLISKVE